MHPSTLFFFSACIQGRLTRSISMGCGKFWKKEKAYSPSRKLFEDWMLTLFFSGRRFGQISRLVTAMELPSLATSQSLYVSTSILNFYSSSCHLWQIISFMLGYLWAAEVGVGRREVFQSSVAVLVSCFRLFFFRFKKRALKRLADDDNCTPFRFRHHEWAKHGSCAIQDKEVIPDQHAYFATALDLKRTYNFTA